MTPEEIEKVSKLVQVWSRTVEEVSEPRWPVWGYNDEGWCLSQQVCEWYKVLSQTYHCSTRTP